MDTNGTRFVNELVFFSLITQFWVTFLKLKYWTLQIWFVVVVLFCNYFFSRCLISIENRFRYVSVFKNVLIALRPYCRLLTRIHVDWSHVILQKKLWIHVVLYNTVNTKDWLRCLFIRLMKFWIHYGSIYLILFLIICYDLH